MNAALTAARERDWAACLAALLVVWREYKDAALAELIDRVGASISVEPVASDGKSIAKRVAAATEADVTAILDVVRREMPDNPRLFDAIVQLARACEADPRIAAALAFVVEHPPFSRTDGALYGDVIAALGKIDDPRFRALVIAGWERVAPRMRYLRKDRKHAEVLRDVAARLAKRTPPSPVAGLPDAIAEIDTLLAAKTRTQKKQASDSRALLQAIYDEPENIALRLVYADALLEAGDPRGEFITLQCNRGGGPVTTRERELLKLHGRAWLGDIEPVVLKSGLEFRNGFVAQTRVQMKKVVHQACFSSALWFTVEDLELNAWNVPAVEFLSDPRWKALRRVDGVGCKQLLQIAARATPPWKSVRMTGWHDSVTKTPSLAALEELEIWGAADMVAAMRALVDSELAKTLRRIRVDPGGPWEMSELFRAYVATRIPELDFSLGWSFLGDDQGSLVRFAGDRATVHLQHSCDRLSRAAQLLARVPKGTTSSVHVENATHLGEWAWNELVTTCQRQHDITPTR
jgi:uncharacterized protein (TIGR02996 family)